MCRLSIYVRVWLVKCVALGLSRGRARAARDPDRLPDSNHEWHEFLSFFKFV